MLLSLRSQEHKPIGTILGFVVAVSAVSFLALLVPHLRSEFVFQDPLTHAPAIGDVRSIGLLLYTKYILPFEASSILLVAAIAGAVMLAKKRSKGAALGETL